MWLERQSPLEPHLHTYTMTSALKLEHITKVFSGTTALNDVGLELAPGEVHALVGENGAGKSTLLKILFGIYPPTSRTISINGETVTIRSPRAANQRGIAMIHQELQQVPQLSAVQNIFLGHPYRRYGLFKDARRMRSAAEAVLERVGADIDARVAVEELSVATRQLVEIAKALLGNARIIAMDEPTSSLTPKEISVLLELVRTLAAEGVSIIYVSHKLDEVFSVADKATILRDGEVVGVDKVANLTRDRIVQMMVGRELAQRQRRTSLATEEKVLEVSGLTWRTSVKDVSFTLHKGEILGVAGLIGSGRTELVRMIAGHVKPTSGEVRLGGQLKRFRTPRDAIQARIGFVPEDRKKTGHIGIMSVAANIGLASAAKFTRLGFMRRRKRKKQTTAAMRDLNLRPLRVDQEIQYFSGGNQQKAIIGRWLVAESDVLIFDEPTRGIDVGAKQEIYDVISELAAAGKSLIVVSSELPEVLRLSDRILVMREGHLAATLTPPKLTESEIMFYATHKINEEAEGKLSP